MYGWLINAFLHQTPDPIIDRVEVWRVCRPGFRSNEVWGLTAQKFDHVTCRVCYFKFCKVVWRRYLGEVGKFNHTVWLIYPRHCTQTSIKIGQHLLKLCTKVFWCFLCPTVYIYCRSLSFTVADYRWLSQRSAAQRSVAQRSAAVVEIGLYTDSKVRDTIKRCYSSAKFTKWSSAQRQIMHSRSSKVICFGVSGKTINKE